MSNLAIIRKLAEYQRYPELRDACQNAWCENQEYNVLPLLASAYGHLGEHQLAEQSYQQLLQYQAQLDIDGRVDLAAVLLLRGSVDEAQQLLQELLAQQADHALAQARLGFCYFSRGDLAAAQSCYERSLVLAPQRIAVHHHLITIYLQRNRAEMATSALAEAFTVLSELVGELPEPVFQQYQAQLNSLQLQCWVAHQQFAYAENLLAELLQAQQTGTRTERDYLYWVMQYARLLAERDCHDQAQELLKSNLEQFPNNSELCLMLAELAQVQGRFMPAVQLLRKALAQDKDNSALWVQLSSACLHRLDKQARKAAEKAVELSSRLEESDELPLPAIKMQQAQAKNALAQVESQEQNFAIAEQLYRDILTDHPNFLPALQGLGQQQMQQGNIEQAVALFERVKQIDPIRGQSALINARRFPEDEETLLKMERAAQMPSLEGSMRAGILFQLASAWEKRKAYDKAFTFANQANAATKKFLPYDGKAHRNQCARLRHAFSKALFEHRRECGVDSTLPVYVLGMPRSGTTLVEQILSGHSDIFGAGELGVIPQVRQGLNRWERHVGSGRQYPDCIDDLNAYVTAGIANNVLKELQEYAPQAKHIVDKLPHNFENIGLIKFLFPKAKIISVRRDPRDIAISNYFTDYQAKHGGMGFAYDLTDIGQQLADHNLLMHHWKQTFPGEILELNYEDVVDDLEGCARKMLDYIGVEWQPQVLKFNELERTVKTASVWQVRQPIYKTSKAKWKRYEQYLQPLIKGTNAKIIADPVDDMLTLPQPGFLSDGVALYKENDLDGAELSFKKMLHHNPEHAACNYMLGLVYLSKHHLHDGIMQLEKALAKAPWHKEWRDNLIKAYQQAGKTEQADALQAGPAAHPQTENELFELPDSVQAIAG